MYTLSGYSSSKHVNRPNYTRATQKNIEKKTDEKKRTDEKKLTVYDKCPKQTNKTKIDKRAVVVHGSLLQLIQCNNLLPASLNQHNE